MKIVKIIAVLLTVLAFSFTPLSAKKAEKLVKIGAVDLQKVFEKSEGRKIAEAQLDKKREEFEKQKGTKEDEIKKLKEDLEGKKSSLSSGEKEKIELDIKTKMLDLKMFIEDSNNKLMEEENKLLEPLVNDIKDVIRAVSIKYGYDIILDKSTYILYIDKEFDITEDVLTELSVKYKK
ncbi:MAG: OmpH family outer membrane protein [bacterium]|nr:OmpH family outer membrane protein [bacterium]